MKKIYSLVMAAGLCFAMNAQNGVVTFTTVDNTNDMLYYASPSMPDSQKIVTDAGLIPAVAAQGLSYSIPQYIVECLATKADMSKGDATKNKTGFATRTAVPALGKVVGIALPGRVTGGNSNFLYATPYIKNYDATVIAPPYKDENYPEYNTIVTNPANGFKKYNEQIECNLGATQDGILMNVPFAEPYIYTGANFEIALYLDVKDQDRSKNVAFNFAKTTAEADIATVYHSLAKGENMTVWFNFYADRDFGPLGQMEAVKNVLQYLALDHHSLPAFQLDFYTNDIRGKVKGINAPVQVKLFSLDPTAKVLVGTVNTTADGKFAFEALDHTKNYMVEVDGYTLEDKVFDFGNDAIKNDLDVLIDVTVSTAVNDVNVAKATTGVTYYNMAGVASSKPFAGLNVVVTEYADGSKTVTKEVK